MNTQPHVLDDTGPGLGLAMVVLAWLLLLTLAMHELDGRYARTRRNECAAQQLVWHYMGDYCALEEVR